MDGAAAADKSGDAVVDESKMWIMHATDVANLLIDEFIGDEIVGERVADGVMSRLVDEYVIFLRSKAFYTVIPFIFAHNYVMLPHIETFLCRYSVHIFIS